MKISLKEALYNTCLANIEEKVVIAKALMDNAQKAANQNQKSSAGDKYETNRAMMQLEKDQAAMQLSECIKLQKALYTINPKINHKEAHHGSLVTCSTGKFFISVSIGVVTCEGQDFFCISPVSPVGKALVGKKSGDLASFNGNEIEVIAVA